MKLIDIYNQLATGELREMAIATGTIANNDMAVPVTNYAKLLPSVTLGLTELHKRFSLKEATTYLALVNGTAIYALAPLNDDILKVERTYGTYLATRYEIPLNIVDDVTSIRTTSYNTLAVPTSSTYAPWLLETSEIEVVYRADHPKIKSHLANAAPEITEILLPSTHLEALLYYVASRQTNPGGMANEFHEGNNYWQRFEAACARLKVDNLELDTTTYSTKFQDRGFC